MDKLLPDCGILSSPSTSSNSQRNSLNSSQSLRSTLDSPSTSGARLGAGSSKSFYKSSTLSPSVRGSPRSSLQSGGSRRSKASGAINRGVGHGIKKPKLKAKNRKAGNPAKASVRRLKKVKPPPRIAQHRSPASLSSPGISKKKHQLSSPGVTLLDSPDAGSHLMPDSNKKFFTSRSRAAATVQINKHVELSASYGTVTLRQSGAVPGLKKNVGKTLTESSTAVNQSSSPRKKTHYKDPLPVESNKPKPTRFSNSPLKRLSSTAPLRSSPRKKSLLNPNSSSLLTPELTSPGKRATAAKISSPARSSPRRSAQSLASKTNTSSPVRSSPRRNIGQSNNKSPLKTPTKMNKAGLSPRKLVLSKPSPAHKLAHQSVRNSVIEVVHQSPNSKSTTPSKHLECLSPVRRSPRHPHSGGSTPKGTPNKREDHQTVSSPALRDTPERLKSRQAAQALTPTKGPTSPLKEHNTKANALNNSSSYDTRKYYDIFDPLKRKSSDLVTFPKKSNTRTSDGLLTSLNDGEQRVLDVGQKDFGAKQCPECGLLYDKTDPDDVRVHDMQHNRIMTSLTFKSSKKERVVSPVDSEGGRFVLIRPSDPPHLWNKVTEVISVVNEELGFASDHSAVVPSNTAGVILYVLENKVAACLVANEEKFAHRVVTSAEYENKENNGFDLGLYCCSEERYKILYAISRIWVRSDCRRKGLARRLVDTFRRNIFQCHLLTKDQFAFSSPTPDGFAFARHYTGREDFLVIKA